MNIEAVRISLQKIYELNKNIKFLEMRINSQQHSDSEVHVNRKGNPREDLQDKKMDYEDDLAYELERLMQVRPILNEKIEMITAPENIKTAMIFYYVNGESAEEIGYKMHYSRGHVHRLLNQGKSLYYKEKYATS